MILNTNITARPIYGWVCSKCDKSYAPSVTECAACNQPSVDFHALGSKPGMFVRTSATGGIIGPATTASVGIDAVGRNQ